MELTGQHAIPAPRDVVWQMLNDPDVLRQCIPGCESLEGNPDDGFSARVRMAIGPVKANFTGKVTLSDMNPPESYTISGEGSGGVAGFASGGADVRLADDAAGSTVLSYTARAKVGGKLAQLGSRLVEGTARKLANEFFTNFTDLATERSVNAPAPDTSATAAPSTGPTLRPWMFGVAAAVGLIAILLIL
jgi:hypothetical protein